MSPVRRDATQATRASLPAKRAHKRRMMPCVARQSSSTAIRPRQSERQAREILNDGSLTHGNDDGSLTHRNTVSPDHAGYLSPLTGRCASDTVSTGRTDTIGADATGNLANGGDVTFAR
jgi:hypothetical protein